MLSKSIKTMKNLKIEIILKEKIKNKENLQEIRFYKQEAQKESGNN